MKYFEATQSVRTVMWTINHTPVELFQHVFTIPLDAGLFFRWYGFGALFSNDLSTFKQVHMTTLQNKSIAILTDHGFEEVELTSPKSALEAAGATVKIVSMQKGSVKAWNHDHWSITVPVDVQLEEANSDDFDGLMIPGGGMNPDTMRSERSYISFAREFLESGKPVAAICHGPQLLIETEMISGRELTSYPSIKTDLKNAGATWYDKEVVVDNGLVTSRRPADLPAFNAKMVEEFAEGVHKRATSMV